LVKVQRLGLNSAKEDWQEKLEIRQMKLDMEIMIMDTSGFTPIQQEYFHLCQIEILKSPHVGKSLKRTLLNPLLASWFTYHGSSSFPPYPFSSHFFLYPPLFTILTLLLRPLSG
jgi:hypothetical protein